MKVNQRYGNKKRFVREREDESVSRMNESNRKEAKDDKNCINFGWAETFGVHDKVKNEKQVLSCEANERTE